MRNHYEILGIPTDASSDQIKRIYRKLAHIYHPDTTVLDAVHASRKFQEINDAYEILSDPARRADYDRRITITRPVSLETQPYPIQKLLPKPQIDRVEIYFGEVAVGEERTERFLVDNIGGPITRVIDFQVSASDDWFAISKVNKLFELEPCPIEVHVSINTTDLIPGKQYRGWVEVDLDGETARTVLTVDVTHKPYLILSTDLLDFGEIYLNETRNLKFRIENKGGSSHIKPQFDQSKHTTWFEFNRISRFSEEDPFPMEIEIKANSAGLVEEQLYSGWISVALGDGDIRHINLTMQVVTRPKPLVMMTATLLRQLKGHREGVWSVAFSPTTNALASGGADNQLLLWEDSHNWQARSPKFWGMRNMFSGSANVWCVAFNSSGTVVAFASWEKILFWELQGGWRLKEIGLTNGYHANSLVYSPDGRWLAADGAPHEVWLIEADSRKVVQRLTGHTKDVRTIAFSPDGYVVASGSEDGTIRLWTVADGRQIACLEGHTGAVRSIAFSPNGQFLASAGSVRFKEGKRQEDKTIRVWRLQNFQQTMSIEGHTQSVECVIFGPTNDILISSSVDTTVRFWDLNTAREIDKITDYQKSVNALALSPDGRMLAVGSWDGMIGLYDLHVQSSKSIEPK